MERPDDRFHDGITNDEATAVLDVFIDARDGLITVKELTDTLVGMFEVNHD